LPQRARTWRRLRRRRHMTTRTRSGSSWRFGSSDSLRWQPQHRGPCVNSDSHSVAGLWCAARHTKFPNSQPSPV